MARPKSDTPREVRNTFYLTLIVVSAVLLGGVWIARVIDIRRFGIVHAVPVTSKIVARSVAKVVEARFDGERLGILLTPPKGKAPSAGGAASPLSSEQESLLRILKNPAARQEPGTPGQTGNAGVETTPQAFIIARVEAARNDLVQRLAALVPLPDLAVLENRCQDEKTPCLRGDREADKRTIQDVVVRGMRDDHVGNAAIAWVEDVSSDVSIAKAWQRLELPGTARGFLLQALARGAITEPVDNAAIASQLRDAVARQLAIDLAVATVSATEAEWAARDIAARLAWGTAAVIFLGLWAAVVSLAVYQIWEFTRSWTAVVIGIGASVGAGLLVALAQYLYQSSFELLGPLLRLLEHERKTEIALASQVLNALAAVSLVLLLGAARALLRRSPRTRPEDANQPVVAADLARRVDGFARSSTPVPCSSLPACWKSRRCIPGPPLCSTAHRSRQGT